MKTWLQHSEKCCSAVDPSFPVHGCKSQWQWAIHTHKAHTRTPIPVLPYYIISVAAWPPWFIRIPVEGRNTTVSHCISPALVPIPHRPISPPLTEARWLLSQEGVSLFYLSPGLSPFVQSLLQIWNLSSTIVDQSRCHKSSQRKPSLLFLCSVNVYTASETKQHGYRRVPTGHHISNGVVPSSFLFDCNSCTLLQFAQLLHYEIKVIFALRAVKMAKKIAAQFLLFIISFPVFSVSSPFFCSSSVSFPFIRLIRKRTHMVQFI